MRGEVHHSVDADRAVGRRLLLADHRDGRHGAQREHPDLAVGLGHGARERLRTGLDQGVDPLGRPLQLEPRPLPAVEVEARLPLPSRRQLQEPGTIRHAAAADGHAHLGVAEERHDVLGVVEEHQELGPHLGAELQAGARLLLLGEPPELLPRRVPAHAREAGPTCRRQTCKRERQSIARLVHEVELERVAHLFRNLVHVVAVARGENHRLEAGAVRREQLFLDAPDGQHLATQGDLSRHADVAPDELAHEQARERDQQRDPGGGTVLAHRSRGNVHVDLMLLEPRRVDAEKLRVRAQIR